MCECALLSSPGNFLSSLLKTGSRRSFNRLGEKLRLSSWFLHGGEGRGQGDRTAAEAPTRPTFLSTATPSRARLTESLTWWSTLALEERNLTGRVPGRCRVRVALLGWAGQQPDVAHRRAHGLSHLYRRPLRRRGIGAQGSVDESDQQEGQNMRKRRLFFPLSSSARPPTSSIHLAHMYLLC